MRARSIVLLVAALLPLPRPASAESRMGSDGAPVWTRKVRLSDDRTFITDGAITLDAALAKPRALPKVTLAESAAKIIEKYLAAPLDDEYPLSEVTASKRGASYVAPSGVALNAEYVDYLARTLAGQSVRLRMKGDMEPVVVLANGKAVGLIMPMKR